MHQFGISRFRTKLFTYEHGTYDYSSSDYLIYYKNIISESKIYVHPFFETIHLIFIIFFTSYPPLMESL